MNVVRVVRRMRVRHRSRPITDAEASRGGQSPQPCPPPPPTTATPKPPPRSGEHGAVSDETVRALRNAVMNVLQACSPFHSAWEFDEGADGEALYEALAEAAGLTEADVDELRTAYEMRGHER